MWDLVPWPGIDPRPPALGAGVLTTGLSGKSPIFSSLRSHLEWLLVSEQIQVWGRGEEGSDQPERWWNLEWPHPVTSPFWYSFLLCYVTDPGWASREDPSGCQDHWVSNGQQDQGFPGREGNWMVKGCPGGTDEETGVREGGVVGHLPLWTFGKRLCFLPLELGHQTPGQRSPQGNDEKLGMRNRWGVLAEQLPPWCHDPPLLHPHHSQVLYTPSPPGGWGRVSRPPSLLPHPLAQGMARRLAGRSPGLRDD